MWKLGASYAYEAFGIRPNSFCCEVMVQQVRLTQSGFQVFANFLVQLLNCAASDGLAIKIPVP